MYYTMVLFHSKLLPLTSISLILSSKYHWINVGNTHADKTPLMRCASCYCYRIVSNWWISIDWKTTPNTAHHNTTMRNESSVQTRNKNKTFEGEKCAQWQCCKNAVSLEMPHFKSDKMDKIRTVFYYTNRISFSNLCNHRVIRTTRKWGLNTLPLDCLLLDKSFSMV